MEVVIDGVRYVPATEAVAGLSDLQTALQDVFWGEGYSPARGRIASELFVRVMDDGEGAPLDEFMADLAQAIASKGSLPPA
ncbi:MAG: hypothetical protein IPO08_19780 [Xanthomonadales bacterium]|nr:hypothetical protein [Xanthomonadales bacterium]